MTDQPRESRTQRFAARTNSAPIESLSTTPADQKLARQLRQIDELFDIIEGIASQGPARFFRDDTYLPQAAFGTLIQLGEVVKSLPSTYRDARPSVNYRAMIRLRDKLAHADPWDVDWNVLWVTISKRIPADRGTHDAALLSESEV
ncbi:DUF86 domain-containing protein [Microbacterium sp. NPDC089698]|uniref:HepT-like ribonuclease domain-containing protein n=1 Tax=Microbacterium sp. NPDC089698 TaxID=3364200 RepID=UPI003805C9D7